MQQCAGNNWSAGANLSHVRFLKWLLPIYQHQRGSGVTLTYLPPNESGFISSRRILYQTFPSGRTNLALDHTSSARVSFSLPLQARIHFSLPPWKARLTHTKFTHKIGFFTAVVFTAPVLWMSWASVCNAASHTPFMITNKEKTERG